VLRFRPFSFCRGVVVYPRFRVDAFFAAGFGLVLFAGERFTVGLLDALALDDFLALLLLDGAMEPLLTFTCRRLRTLRVPRALRELRALRDRTIRSGRFQPMARSARNLAGIAMMPSS
jgi:hypothetical protein